MTDRRCICCLPGCDCMCEHCTCAAIWQANFRECFDAECPARRDGYRHAHRIRETA